MKGLKVWQAILLVFSSIMLVTGGVVLYTYLTNGFGSQKIEAEGISFEKDDGLFNANLNQLEVDSDFTLTISATNTEVTEKEITLSFAKSSSGNTYETYVIDGVTYISNGIISIPQKVELGEEFTVKIDQTTYSYNGQSFDANAGGITTIKAKSSNILDSVGAELTVAVDVPVEKIDLTVIDTSTGKEYPIDANGVSKVLQNANFEIEVNYYPTLSRYRYSDNYFKSFHSGEEILSVFSERVKDHCYEIVSGSDVVKHYNDGDIYFSSTGNLTSGNKVKAYVFQTAKKQEDFESTGLTIQGEDYYNAMLSYLAKANDGIETSEVNFSVEQAGVGNVHITLNTSESNPIVATTNRLFTLVASNSKLGDASLGLAIQDEEGTDLSSMISQTALKIRYKKLGEVDFVDLVKGDTTVVVKSVESFLLGDKPNTANPYVYGGKTYFFGNSGVKDLKNTYWEISTNEESIIVEVEVVLFRTIDGETTIFDESGALLGANLTRKAFINFLPVEEGDVAWSSTNEQLNIIYNGTTQVPTQIDLAKNTNVPTSNIYQKVQYYIAKVLDDKGSAVDAGGNPISISATDANVDMTSIYNVSGVDFALVKSSDLLFRRAGTYSVIFVTIRTDAYGNIVDTDREAEGVQFGIQEISNTMTITVAETLQSFSATLAIEDTEKYGIFKRVAKEDVITDGSKTYYQKAADGYSYELAATLNPDTTVYYELNYFAIMTGEEGAITLDIQVSESDCTMINRELDDDKLKFYAISADGETELELSYIDNGVKDTTDDGVDNPRVKSVKLNISDVTINDNSGRGKAFYIKIVYDNTVEKVNTLASMTSNGLSVDVGEEKVHNCFMLYTPSARNIYSPKILEVIEGTDVVTTYLDGQTLDANISMTNEAKYDECNILLNGEVINKDASGNIVNGKTWINERIKETIVTDAYERLYVREDGVDEYEVSVSAGVVSVDVFNNELIFNSGKENARITVSAGADCYYSFDIRTESSGLKRVSTTAPGATEPTVFNSSSNVYVNINGGTSIFDTDLNFYNCVTVEVGSYNAGTGSYTILGDAYKFFYLNNLDIENLSMFEFVGLDDTTYDTIYETDKYASDALGTKILTGDTPIKALKIKENFARSFTLSIAVKSENYAVVPKSTVSAVSFELKVNLSSVVSAVANINDKFVNNDEFALEDGIYAGTEYFLDRLISLTRLDIADPTTNKIKWGESGPYQTKHYILNDGTVTTTYDADRTVGEISEGKIHFYDVDSVKEYFVKFYYYNTNENAYYTEVTFKVYPNLQIVKSTGSGIKEDINLIELAKLGASEYSIIKFCTISRIRGAMPTAGVEYRVLNGDNYVVKISGSTFAFNSNKSLSLDYNKYNDTLELGLFLNGNRVKLPNGEEQIYNINVKLTDSVEDELLIHILQNISGDGIGTVVYNGVTALSVCYPFADDYIVNTNQLGNTATNPFFVSVVRNTNVYNLQSGKLNFLPSVSEAVDGFRFGEDCVLIVLIKGGSADKDSAFDIATIQIPLYISTVGQHYAYYEDYNDGHPDDPTTPEIESLPTDGFDLKTLLYGEVDGDNNLAPYATFDAGKQYQIAYVYDGDYEKDASGNYIQAIYYDENVLLDSITFENGTKECDYAKIIIGDSGNWYLHIANISNNTTFITLKVQLSQGSSLLAYTYRIKVNPNVETNAIYPFATGENGAEYETISGGASYDLTSAFGSYAGDKATNTRFNLVIETAGGDFIIDEKETYYARQSAYETVNGQYILPAHSSIYDDEGNQIVVSTSNSLSLESVGEAIEFVDGSDEWYVPIVFTTARYVINEIRVGGNTTDAGEGALFDTFVNSGDVMTRELATGVMFLVEYTFANGVRTYTIKANESVVAIIALSENGELNFSSVDNSYFINLVITKEYNNIVNGDINYRLNINNTSGINYVEYRVGTEILESGESLGVVETDLTVNTMYSLQTKYTTGNGTSNKDLDLSYTFSIEDRTGAKVTELTKVLKTALSDTVNITDTFDASDYGVLLVKNNAGNYSLYINRASFVDQDYKLLIYFNAKTVDENGAEESFRVSEFIVKVKGSVSATLRVPDSTPTLNAGSTLSVGQITALYNISGATVSSVSVEGVNGETCPYIDGTRIADMVEGKEIATYDLVFNEGTGSEFFLSLDFAIVANISPLEQYRYTDIHYATDEIEVEYNYFYGTTSFGTVALAYSIPETFKDYIDTATIDIDNTAKTFTFKTNHVANKVKNVKINLIFTYTFGTYTYSFNSALVFDIEPYAILTTNYPNPQGEEDTTLEYESVIFGNTYENFFASYANFVEDNNARLQIVKAKDGSELAYDAITVAIKEISGIEVYAKVKTPANADIDMYYEKDGDVFKLTTDASVVAGKTYYLLFSPRQLDETLTGDQEFTFMPYAAYADGYVIFDIEFNKVKTEYKVYAFKEIIEQEIVNSVNYVDGVEEIFLEQLAEGNILAEDTVACLEMGASVPSGTYYIKLNNPNDNVNPKHWVGFKYDATKGSKIYVHLGQVGYIDEDYKNIAGYIEGVYASKTSINDLRANDTIALSLTSFLNLKYVTVIDGVKTTVEIDRDYDYTSILDAEINEEEATLPTPLYKDVDGKYYTIDEDGEKTEVIIDESLLKQALYGNYEVYDDYVTYDGDEYFVSKVEEVVEDSGSGFGQGLSEVDKGILNSSGNEVYRYTNTEGANVFVNENETTNIYDTAVKVINPGLNVFEVDYNVTVTTGSPKEIVGLDNIANPYFDQNGYRYYIANSAVKFDDIEAYKLAEVSGVDTSITYQTTSGSMMKAITVVENKINGLVLTNITNGSYRAVSVTSDVYDAYKSYFIAYKDAAGETHNSFDSTLSYNSSYTYYISSSSVSTVSGVKGTIYEVVFGTGCIRYFLNGQGYTGYDNVYILTNNAAATTVILDATYSNKLLESGTPTTITDKTLNLMTSFGGNNFTLDGTTYFIENLSSIKYTFDGPYEAKVLVKLDEATATSFNATKYSHFKIDKTDETHHTSINFVNTTDVRGADGIGATKTAIITKDGKMFIVNGLSLNTTTDFAYKVFSAGVREVYKETTTRHKVNVALPIEDGITAGTIKVVDLDTGDGKVDYYVYDGKYFRARDVIARIYSGDTYIIASLQTFNINNIDGLVVNDTVKIRFNYVLDNYIGKFEFKFKINMDADIENSILSTISNENAVKLVNEKGEEVVFNDKSVNVIELDTNVEYNFNELVGAIRPSSGQMITAEDVRSSSDMSIEVLPVSTLDIELSSIMTESDIATLKAVLGDDLKDNTDTANGSKVIRLSYELVRATDNANSKVFNFNLLPMGADNDGDYVIVKYSYNIEVGDYIWKTTDHETYSISRYVLFKINPDYEVAMSDSEGNPVVVETTLEDTNNYDNPVLITDFERIGEILPNGKTLGDALKDMGVSETDLTTWSSGYFTELAGEPEQPGRLYFDYDETIGGKTIRIEYKYGLQQTTATNSNQTHTAITLKVDGAEKTYFLRNMENVKEDMLYDTTRVAYYVEPENVLLYENVQLPIYTNTQSGFVKVTANNASVDANKNIVASVFNGELKDYNGGSDIASYIETSYASGYDVVNRTLAKGNNGLRLAIKQVISLGERNFQVVLTDIYGYTINFYFSMVATANPTYAAGALEFQEGNTFDIGAQFEEVSISQYVVNTPDYIYYPVGVLTKFEQGENYYYISNNIAGSCYMVKTNSTNKEFVPEGLSEDDVDSDSIIDSDAGIVYASNTLISSGTWEDTSKVKKTNVTISLESSGTPVPGRIYYKQLATGTIINETENVNIALNLPKGYGNGDDITTMTVSTTEYVLIPTSILLVSAEGISTIVKSPEENTSPSPVPSDEELKNYVDTIELTGINAFGYKKAGMNKSGIDTNKYFNTGCDLDNIIVKQLEYKYQGVSLITKTFGAATDTLASSKGYYKYDSTDEMGRYINIKKYTIPTLPGWVYEDRDYAYITLEITLADGTGATAENYTLPIEIKVSKYSDNIISQKSVATNISDDTEFNVVKHIDANTSLGYTYYDDTVAVTLPGNGKVSVKVEAMYNRTAAGGYYVYVPSSGSYSSDTALVNAATREELYVYDSINHKYFKAYYSGTTTLFSNYATMDSTYYLGLSQTVGHTLNTNYDVTIKFFDYDNTRVTRNGNFGFYATYGVDNLAENGNAGKIFDDKTIVDVWTAGLWSYVYGYGQLAENGNLNEFTLVYGDPDGAGTEFAEGRYVIPTEAISRGDDDKIKAGTDLIAYENFNNKVGAEKTIEIKNGVNTGTETEKWQEYNSTTYFDKLTIADAGNFVGDKLLITKYYLATCGAGDAAGQTYQFIKDYNVYPKYFNISTSDPINNRISATSVGEEDVDGISYHTFNLSDWGGEVTLTYYGQNGTTDTAKLNAVNISPFYFELGEKGTTSAKIDRATGKLYAKTSEYKLNGDEYVSINIYVKASGENSEYVDDNLLFSGNDNNKPKINVKIYLNSGMSFYDKLVELETLASSWTNPEDATMTDRDKVLGYFRSAESSYTTEQWTTFAGPTTKIVSDFVPIVSQNAYLASLRGMSTYSPSADWSIDYIHYYAALDMYNNTSNKTYNLVTLTPQKIADLGGWGGDLASIIVGQASVADGNTVLSNALSLIKATSGSSFGSLDYCADIDASNIWNLYLKGNTSAKIGTSMETYYETYTTTQAKVVAYLEKEFGYTYGTKADDLAEISALTDIIVNRITGNNGILGYMAKEVLPDTATALQVAQAASTFASTYETQIEKVCEAYAIKLLQDIGAM